MKKQQQLLALLLAIIFLISGCSNGKNILNTNPTEATTHISTNEDDINASNSHITYDYDFSIYNDGRSFSADDIAVQSDFENFLKEIFIKEMSSSTATLNFSIEHPENYGIEPFETTWGEYIEYNTSDLSSEKELYNQLMTYNYDSLTYEQQIIYDIYKKYLDDTLALEGNKYMPSVLSPMGGIQSTFPIIFSEYNFLEKTDVEECIDLVIQSYNYTEYLCEYELYRCQQGYALSSYSIDTVISQCKDFINANPNSLVPVFKTKLEQLEVLSKEEREAYLEEFTNGVDQYLIPAYELIVTTLEEIQKKDVCLNGLSNYDGGKEYYQYLVSSNTGSAKTVDELFELCQAAIDDALMSVSSLYLKNPNLISDMENFEYPANSPEEMMALLHEALEADFPDAKTNNYSINYVPESLQDTMSPAFYVIPPIDNNERNIIYINENEAFASMNIFPTIAHEGFPGHMYQVSYFYSLSPHYFRSLFNLPGYNEGWAHYIENNYSYKYAEMDRDLADAFFYNSQLNFAIYCITDIGIHYYGWDYDYAKEFLGTNFALDEESIPTLYYTLVDDPAVYLRYFIGSLEILSLRDIAEETLDDGFDIKEFHRFILEIGPGYYDIIQDRMTDWMDRVMDK